MIRIGDGNFIQNEPYMDTVVAIRIEKGEYYFLGWMEEAENYNIQIAKHPENCLLGRDCFSDFGSLHESITDSEGYNRVYVINSTDPYREFLSHVRSYERNGIRDKDDHDIFCVTESELYALADALRDGDYVFVIEN